MNTQEIDDDGSMSCWSVEDRAWKQERPDLPDDVIALLATPVVVSASVLGEEPDEDEEDEHWPAPTEPCADVPTRFLAPAPPRRTARRTSGRIAPRRPARLS